MGCKLGKIFRKRGTSQRILYITMLFIEKICMKIHKKSRPSYFGIFLLVKFILFTLTTR